MLHCCYKQLTSDLKVTKFGPPQFFSGYALVPVILPINVSTLLVILFSLLCLCI